LGFEPRVKFDEILRILLAQDLRLLGCDVPFETEPTPAPINARINS
jgi:hypothetical protein